MDKFKDKLLQVAKKVNLFLKVYVKTNVLFISFVILTLFNSTVLRFYTVEKFWNIKPVLADLAVILLFGSLSYPFNSK